MLALCNACSLRICQIKSPIIKKFVVKVSTFVILFGCQNFCFDFSYKALILEWILLKSVCNFDLNMCMWSGCITLRLEFLNPVLKSFPKILACKLRMLIIALFFNVFRLRLVGTKISISFFLIFWLRRTFQRLCFLDFLPIVKV